MKSRGLKDLQLEVRAGPEGSYTSSLLYIYIKQVLPKIGSIKCKIFCKNTQIDKHEMRECSICVVTAERQVHKIEGE